MSKESIIATIITPRDATVADGIENIRILREFQIADSSSLLQATDAELRKLNQLLVSPFYDLFNNLPADQRIRPILHPDEDTFEYVFPAEAITAYRDGPNNKPLPGGRKSARRSKFTQSTAGAIAARQQNYIIGSLIPFCACKVLNILRTNNKCQDIESTPYDFIANATPMEMLYVTCKVLDNNGFTKTEREIKRAARRQQTNSNRSTTA